jgi:hypothetical protein
VTRSGKKDDNVAFFNGFSSESSFSVSLVEDSTGRNSFS